MNPQGEVRRDGDVLAVAGELNMASAGNLVVTGARLLREGALAVDLSEVSGADSAGLALLLEWSREARSLGRDLAVGGAPSQLLKLARLYQLSEVLPMTGRSVVSPA